MRTIQRFVTALISLSLAASSVAAPSETAPPGKGVVYSLQLPGKRTATVSAAGFAVIKDQKKNTIEMRRLPQDELHDKGEVLFDLMRGPQSAFVPGRVIVVFQNGVQASSDVQNVPAQKIQIIKGKVARRQTFTPPALTNDAKTNYTLATIGTQHMERLFRGVSRSTLSSMRLRAQALGHRNMLDISSAYRMDITNASVRSAVLKLRKLPGVAYASADWRVVPQSTRPVRLPPQVLQQAVTAAAGQRRALASATQATLPSNYALTSSAQSMLNSPSNDAVAAYDEVQKAFQQLPGEGEIITNVSLGDLLDANISPYDDCSVWESFFGPTTVVMNGQRYINWPSMPLIPTYVSDNSGHVNGMGRTCGQDPFLDEIGLDFSMMAPLPHTLQRSGEQGNGFTDLLGIAPGAQYRLVVPQGLDLGPAAGDAVGVSDIDGALVAAANQTPTPDVITASLGIGVDVYGFPSRYLEDDRLTNSLIAGLVSQYNIVICVSAGDGTRLFTNAAVAPSGGSAATNLTASPTQQTDLDDITFSTAPSIDLDSGSIDVGGTTLDDIFSAEPQDPANAALKAQHAFAETRWNGFEEFSSGFGSRVNVAAPSDNVTSLSHTFQGAADAVDVGLNGGTSASAPEVAAAAAVVRQVGRLTGHTLSPLQVRQLLNSTGNPIPNVSQADMPLAMGTALDLRQAVETLLTQAGHPAAPAVPRVAIEQRQQFQTDYSNQNGTWDNYMDHVFVTNTNPSNIDLLGPSALADGTQTGENAKAWITIAPDWEGLPANAAYKLYVTGKPAQVLATTSYARLLPEEILSAAGQSLVSNSSRTVSLTYQATFKPGGSHTATSALSLFSRATAMTLSGAPSKRLATQFSLTFGPAAATTREVLAPIVPAVVRTGSIPVTYDLTNARNLSNPVLLVSEPGRMSPQHGGDEHPSYQVSLAGQPLKGKINVPLSSLQGGGIYGIHILFGSNSANGFTYQRRTDTAYVRVEPSASDARPPAPLLSAGGGVPSHILEIPYAGSFQVTYDVSNASGATGALLEISAPGPTGFANFNTFNNPNGTSKDANGVDRGSIYTLPLSGASGTVTINSTTAHLYPSMYHTIRVIPMNGSTPAAESSDVSTITMDGINPNDGGSIASGFGINQNGTDGFLTTFQFDAADQFTVTFLADYGGFDQGTQAMTGGLFGSPVAPNPSTQLNTLGWGIWANDQGLLHFENSTFNLGLVMNPQTGFPNSFLSPPIAFSDTEFMQSAPNSTNTQALILANDTTQSEDQSSRLFTSDLASGTGGPVFDITAPLQNPIFFGRGHYWGITQNPNNGTAVLVAGDKEGGLDHTVVTVDYSTGAITTFSGSGNDELSTMALDPSTNILAYLTAGDSGLNICHVSSQTCTDVQLPLVNGFPAAASEFFVSMGVYVAADPGNHLFLVSQFNPSDVFSNNNVMSDVLVYDESGRLLNRYEDFFFYDVAMPDNQAGLQLNPATRTGYTFGPFQTQLQSLKY